ncbi:hypothetical protein F0562_002473 [Nyssa sinensis]|uniref:Uncharacterized protein n=1 Tax=Nyssa sinensis TaxID=561372 RepID=A0A5J5C6J2_9ASTE|nr:hypothetical protein F0562_002473 [Nyssa sinensis]
MGAGYQVAKDGVVTENYWEQIEEEPEQDRTKKRRPYRIELVGVDGKTEPRTLLVDPDEIDCLKKVGRLNEEADCIYELYKRPSPAYEDRSVWKDIVLSPSRLNIEQELKYPIQRVERLKA